MRNKNRLRNFGKKIIAAEMAAYRLDWRIKGGAIFVKGDRMGAEEITRKLEKLGWSKEVKPGGAIYVYTSPDGKWKINLRTISSSEDKVERAGYKVEATLDVIEIRGNDKYNTEIKFIILK